MANDAIEKRIRERAYQIWLDEGMPVGKAEDHWELAKFAISQEDGLETMLVPQQPSAPESASVATDLREFPTLTDQGRGQASPSPDEMAEQIPSGRPGGGS